MSFFDAYEIRARLMPAALIASPLLLPLFAFGLVSASTLMSTALASALVVMVIYLFSHVVAFLGRRSEPALWESWGGSPSLTVVSDADKTFPAATKKAIQNREGRRMVSTRSDGHILITVNDNSQWNWQAIS